MTRVSEILDKRNCTVNEASKGVSDKKKVGEMLVILGKDLKIDSGDIDSKRLDQICEMVQNLKKFY